MALLQFQPATAQLKLEGLVTNPGQQPVPYPVVSLEGTSAASPLTMQADSNGHFIFTGLEKKDYQLTLYALGFSKQTVSFSLTKDTFIRVTLDVLKGDLDGLTVVGNRPVIVRKADRTIFNVTNSVNAAGSNGLDMLRKTPGIIIKDNTISLAGKGDLGVMINGRLLHLSDKALADRLKALSATQIARVEVITSPSARYDAEGNAGLINIITRKSVQEGLSGNIAGSVKRFFYKDQPDYKGIRNYGDMDGSAALNYNYKRWSAYANAGYTAGRELWGYGIDVYYPEKHWAMKDTGEYRIATLNALGGINYQWSERTALGFEYNYIFHIEDGADYVRVPVYGNGGKPDSTLKTYATYYPVAKSNAFNLHLVQALGQSGGKLTLNADYFNSYRHDRSDLITRSYDREGKVKAQNTRELYDTALQNIRIYTFKADLELPTRFAQLSMGGKLSFIDNYSDIFYYDKTDGGLQLDPELSNQFRYLENTQALYANASRKAGPWETAAGLRAELTQTNARSYFGNENVKKDYLKIFPSLLTTYQPDPDNRFSLSYNKRIHRPTFWNLNPFKSFMSAYTYVEGNPYLEPEYITNIEASHLYKNRLTSSLYAHIINNGFAQVIRTHETGGYIHTTTLLNFIKSYRYGISESLSFHPFPWMESANTVRGYYTRVRSNLSYIPDIDGWGAYLETNNTFSLNRDKSLNGFLGFWYQFPGVDQFGRSNTYYNVDAGIQWLTLQKRLTLSLNYSDIFRSSASKVFTTVDQIRNTYTDFQLNSQLKFSVSWNFGNENNKRVPANTGNEAERARTN